MASKKGSKKGGAAARPLVAAGRVVRDSFSMPEAEYQTVAAVQKRMIKKERVVSKSEVMRAAFAVLNRLSDKELLEIFDSLPKVRPGRPTD